MPSVLAIAAHPDDIEFLFAGTMLMLAKQGWDLHYMNVADGSRGSTTMDRETCAATRLAEAQQAADLIGAKFHKPICHDMEIAYTTENLQKVTAVVRESQASIVLVHSPIDYMEDHEVACKLGVSAAFSHAMPNLESIPPTPHYDAPVTVYHAQPLGNRHPTGELIHPHFYVDTAPVIEKKTQALACHASQKQWLDESQGLESYLETMLDESRHVGELSGKFEHAEGWRRREHRGFCGENDDPLRTTLHDFIVESKQ
ncbi:PIG-L deacetylase family protein [Allorhodopirellula solitaria]|uniref:GlcNAc-PI de-N-acetylase n=1 Tax=Allorhodopirellula solitaria TaxID=2527987 RepID=A0A5C5YIM5_9BACT|nr:PIG-L family deacetylase [Allorhodopirellula solitaria]TWT74723.1 GlcNAc-PI de-N-acetylase [Allorhodopirellula solitaria]